MYKRQVLGYEMLRLKNLKAGDYFKFTYDIRTSPWTKSDGSPGETTLVFSRDQTYVKVSPRKIQPCRTAVSLNSLRISHQATGRVSGLGKGQGDLPVTTAVV